MVCPICMEPFSTTDPSKQTRLLCCGQQMCTDCERKLHNHNQARTLSLTDPLSTDSFDGGTCPYCRSPFPTTDQDAFAAAFKHAHKGKTWAKIVIGELYMQGKGCTQSFQDAQKCFEFAADANDSIAQLYLGHMHACGDGNVEQSYETGRIYYELAATQGLLLASNCLHVLDVLKKEKITQDPDSTYVLSTWYRTGHTPIIQKSRGRSLELLQLAMERGCSQLETRQNECAAMEKEIKIEKQNEHKKQKHRKKQQSQQRSNRNGSQKSMKCEKYWSSGSCKFGDACRNSHDETGVIARFDLHVHSIGPDSSKKRKKNLCDKCGKKTKTTGFRCISGCDWDICLACLE